MKKLNLVVGIFVAAAIIVLVVLLVRTFFVDVGVDKPASSPTPSLAPTPTPTPTPPDGAFVTHPEPSSDVPTTPAGEPLEGTEMVLAEGFFGREQLKGIYSSELFDCLPTDIGNQFTFKSGNANETFVETVFIEDDLETQKAIIMDWYIPEFTGTVDKLGQVLIPGTSITAEGLAASTNSRNVEAWLIEAEMGFLAVIVGYNDEASRDAAYRMIGTLELIK